MLSIRRAWSNRRASSRHWPSSSDRPELLPRQPRHLEHDGVVVEAAVSLQRRGLLRPPGSPAADADRRSDSAACPATRPSTPPAADRCSCRAGRPARASASSSASWRASTRRRRARCGPGSAILCSSKMRLPTWFQSPLTRRYSAFASSTRSKNRFMSWRPASSSFFFWAGVSPILLVEPARCPARGPPRCFLRVPAAP